MSRIESIVPPGALLSLLSPRQGTGALSLLPDCPPFGDRGEERWRFRGELCGPACRMFQKMRAAPCRGRSISARRSISPMDLRSNMAGMTPPAWQKTSRTAITTPSEQAFNDSLRSLFGRGLVLRCRRLGGSSGWLIYPTDIPGSTEVFGRFF